MQKNITIWTAVFVASLWLAGCSQPPRTESGIAATAEPQHKHAHAQVYQLDPQQSTIVLKVYRDGPLARFGHNHVIAATGVSGTVYREKELADSDFELSIPVAQMAIDRPADRAAAGVDFSGELSEFAIAGTRANMLGPKLLAAEQYPEIKLNSAALGGELPNLTFTMKVVVRGVERQLSMPARVVLNDKSIQVDGQFSLSQMQLGLTPFSVLGGGLRVRDAIDVNYHLFAVRGAAAKSAAAQ